MLIWSSCSVHTIGFDGDFRHCMCCQTFWAFTHTIGEGFTCTVDRFDKDRPDDLGPDQLRYMISGVFDRETLMRWPCEFRYTKKEYESIIAGKYRDAHVTTETGVKIRETVLRLGSDD